MKIRLKQIAIGIGILLVMTFLFIKTNDIEPDSHNRFVLTLRHTKELDAMIDKDILESRYGLLSTYDRLNKEIAELNQLQTELKNVPSFLGRDETENVNKFLKEIGDLQNQKTLLIERFKSRNAIINNSLRYFPVAASANLQDASSNTSQSREIEPLNYLVRDVLTYYLLADTNLKDPIDRRIELLQQKQGQTSSGTGKTDVDITISHARTILKLKPEVDGLIEQLFALPTSAKVEELIGVYHSFHDRSLQRAGIYQFLLYFLSVLLVAYIGFIFVRLKKATSALRASKKTLEQRVLNRTNKLAASNLDLEREVAERRRLQTESEVMAEIIQNVISTPDLVELLKQIHQSIGKLFSIENCFVALYDPKTDLLDMQFWADKFDSIPDPFPIRKGLTAYVYRKGQPVLLTADTIRQLVEQGDLELHGTAPEIWLGVPLNTPNGIVGVLVVQHYENSAAYDQKDLAFLTSVGDQIALAIERKRAEEERLHSEANFRDLFDNAPIAYHELDSNGCYTRINRTEELLLGYTNAEVRGRHPAEFIVEKVSREATAAKLDGKLPLQAVERTFIRKDGTHISVLNEDRLIYDANGKTIGIRSTLQDITERKSLEDQLTHQTLHDPLTKIANRVLFRDRLQHALDRAGRHRAPVAVLFVDLDNFKTVNDTLGHEAGDKLLVSVTERLQGCLRTSDTPARFGGDEFAVLVEDIEQPEGAVTIAERIRRVIAEPFSISGKQVFVGTSIGIAMTKTSHETPEELIRNADRAMYVSKSKGKGQYTLFDPKMKDVLVTPRQTKTVESRAKRKSVEVSVT